MGTFTVPIEICDPEWRQFQPLEALVDTGATYLVVPATTLRSLGIQPIEKGSFSLGAGRTAEYDIGLVSLRLEGRTLPVLCVFGDQDSEPLLGAIALESFRVAVDPIAQQLIPVTGRLM